MKKVITCLLAAALITGSAAVLPENGLSQDNLIVASAEETVYSYKGFKYTLGDDGKYCFINGYTGKKKNIVIPSKINGKPVLLGFTAIYNNMNYTRLAEIPGIKSIKINGNIDGLYEEDGVIYAYQKDIEKKYKDYQYSILIVPDGKTKYTISSKVKSLITIGAECFLFGDNIKELTIPNSVKNLGAYSLSSLRGLKKIYFPKKCKVTYKDIESSMLGFYNVKSDDGTTSTIKKNKDLVIYCYSGRTAHKYAKENGFKYILRDKNKSNIKYLYSKGKVKLSKTSYTYNGKAKKPKVTVKYGKTTLKKGRDYTLSYKYYKKAGVATAVIKGKGKYDGTLKKNYTIKPRATSITKISSPSTGEIELSYKKSPTAKGYKIEYSKNKSFKNSSRITSEQLKERIYDLDRGKTYYVRVRPFVSKEFDKFIYGKYSAVKKITVKD